MKALKIAVILLLMTPLVLMARIESHEFDDPAKEALYVRLTKELRCLVCQNQNLADSNADLAKDLRDRAYEMVKQGKSYEEITAYMIERYGDFVMYAPPVKQSTYLLWLGPFLFLIIALVVLFSFMRKRASSSDTPPANDLKAARKHLDK